jgi:hypothetical protein
MEKVFNTGINPVHSGLYVVDRGDKLGTPFRWFNVESQEWSRCEYLMEDVMSAKDVPGALGFLPWRGPIKVLAKQPTTVALVADTPTVKVAKAPKVKAVKVAKAPKVAKVAKVSNKQTYADGTIVFRADRNKYMAWFGGKSEAARPTVDAAKSFLTKKYGITEFTVIDKE